MMGRPTLPSTKVYRQCRYVGLALGVEWYGRWVPADQYETLLKYARLLSCAGARVWVERI